MLNKLWNCFEFQKTLIYSKVINFEIQATFVFTIFLILRRFSVQVVGRLVACKHLYKRIATFQHVLVFKLYVWCSYWSNGWNRLWFEKFKGFSRKIWERTRNSRLILWKLKIFFAIFSEPGQLDYGLFLRKAESFFRKIL